MNIVKRMALSVGLCLSLGVTTARAAAEKTPEAPKGPVITTSGFVDVYFAYNGNGKDNGITPPYRIFDASDNTFRTALVQYSVDVKESKAGAHFDLIFGETADILGPTGGFGPTNVNFKQAYVTYQLSSKLLLTGGKFATGIGYEVIESINNLNYTRSYIFGWTIPFDHTGLKAAYTFSDKVNAMLMVANSGWNDESSASSEKTYHLQVIANPSPKIGFVANLMTGDEFAPADSYKRTVFNGILNLNPTPKFYAGVDVTYGLQKITVEDTEHYTGLAGYLSYLLSGSMKAGLRLEQLTDEFNITGVFGGSGGEKISSATLTLACTKGKLTKKIDLRYDEAVDADGEGVLLFNPGRMCQRTITAGCVYSF